MWNGKKIAETNSKLKSHCKNQCESGKNGMKIVQKFDYASVRGVKYNEDEAIRNWYILFSFNFFEKFGSTL